MFILVKVRVIAYQIQFMNLLFNSGLKFFNSIKAFKLYVTWEVNGMAALLCNFC